MIISQDSLQICFLSKKKIFQGILHFAVAGEISLEGYNQINM
jgi:hypothetical protein